MPKLKTHSGAKKRFKKIASGKVKAKSANTSHFMRRRSQDAKREARQGLILFKTDGDNIVKHYLRMH